ncbi:hypothetical protein [Bacillus sp. ISL-7]|nr:hypothetical protein [Bacillus sp. ISL-7]MBT2736724.1 hypothetical protein [Bacillus sp. ISL-7]
METNKKWISKGKLNGIKVGGDYEVFSLQTRVSIKEFVRNYAVFINN